MKKGLIIGLSPILTGLFPVLIASAAWSANIIDLTVSSKDIAKYKEKPEKYQFSSSEFKLNNGPVNKVEEMETRGQGSISYRRRNFDLKLEDKISVGRVEGKKINLLSMGADKGYISTRLGLMIAESLQIGKGLPSEYVEVKINGHSNGLYTLVEKPKAALDKSPLVVRRGYKSRFLIDEAEVSKKLTVAQINEIKKVGTSIYAVLETKKGADLFNDLKQKMDIESYMRWMVMNSLLRNGDYPDEVFFYVDSDLYKEGRIYFRIMPWDFDDLFKEMHGVSINKIEAAKPENKDSILYSYEDKLDRAFAPANTYMYEQLKVAARELLDKELNKENTDRILSDLEKDLSEYLDNSAILQMGALDSGREKVPYTKKEILDLLQLRKKQIDERRLVLKEKIK